MKKQIVIYSLSLLSMSVFAQTKWTLRQCIDYALENNVELKQKELNVKQAEIELSTSRNSRLPNLNARLGQNFDFAKGEKTPEPGAAPGDKREYVAYNTASSGFNINSSVPIFTGFKIPNQIEKNKLDLSSALEGLKKAEENLSLQVANLYLDVLFKKEILKAYEEQAALSHKQVENTAIMVEVGKIPESQLFDIKSQAAKDELNVTMAINRLELSLLDMSQALNFHDIQNFDIEEPKLKNFVKDYNKSLLLPGYVYKQALQIKPHVKEAEYNVESSKKALNIAKADYYPTLNLDGSYGNRYIKVFNRNSDPLSEQLKYRGSYGIGLSLNIPIFNRFSVRNSVKSARLNIENQELALENVKLTLLKEIEQSYQSAVGAQAKYAATEKAKEAAEISYRYVQESYGVGKATVLQLTDAQTKLLSSKSEQIQAKYDFIFRTKILDFYQGKEIDLE